MAEEDAKAQAPGKTEEAKPEDKDRELQSRLHRRTAEAEKKAVAAEKERDEVRAELSQVRREYDRLLETSDVGGDAEARIKHLAKLETDLEKRDKQLQAHARTLSARLLSQLYGIPEKDLEGFDDPRDMKIAALEWQIAHPPKNEEKETPAKAKEEPGAEPATADLGEAYVPGKSFTEMSDEEYKKASAKMEASARAKAIRSR